MWPIKANERARQLRCSEMTPASRLDSFLLLLSLGQKQCLSMEYSPSWTGGTWVILPVQHNGCHYTENYLLPEIYAPSNEKEEKIILTFLSLSLSLTQYKTRTLFDHPPRERLDYCRTTTSTVASRARALLPAAHLNALTCVCMCVAEMAGLTFVCVRTTHINSSRVQFFMTTIIGNCCTWTRQAQVNVRQVVVMLVVMLSTLRQH